jgi:putative intracellular protease/amidase
MVKKVLCFIYDGYADFETVLVSVGINESEDYEVVYVAYEKEPIVSSSGLKIIPDKKIALITNLDDIEGLMIPGGSERIIKPELESLVKKLYAEKKLIAAICAAPEFLARMGLLDGVKYTTSNDEAYYEEKEEKDPFPREMFTNERMERDRNIITAKGHAFTDFALEIWEWFNLYEEEDERETLRKDFTPG